MKVITSLLVLAGAVSAHYNFPALIYNGVTNADWQHVRQWTDYYTYQPVTTVLTDDIRCNVNGTVAFAPSILSVAAGSQLGFTVGPDIYHPGPLMAYLGIVPKGSTAANWDASGTAWFKIFEDAPTGYGTSALVWPSNGDTTVTFTIPAQTPSGDYLIRVEQIGLHVAQSEGGAQFYLSCGQITITNGGNGTPGPLVAFPGAYSPTDPGILIDIYYPVPTNYTPPGPPVWPPTSTGVATSSVVITTPPSSSTTKSTTTAASPTSSSGSTGGCTVAEYGQCGGMTYTGCKTCQSGTTCSAVSPPYYSQCL